MPADYLLSVDLGTSHTVAMLVWPDGRTRPLLFDGSPVMPSAVFLDPSGTFHTGRDAERLALTAPERFEPNPKQRIGDRTMLLGDREVPVTSALAAILARVARAAVEAVGRLPNTVLTCPAAWSDQRRGALHDAAAQAGYRPVDILTEPVAAAHYYTTRLAHPLQPGQALAVFDFGGGTLDIAVLERRQDGSFGVLADGGLPDLGGLDFDAALVAHIGETVKQRDPDIWKRLENPNGASELRNRRELWEEIRAAKEMLSRSSVAPVTVPDMAQSLHLTRGELDQLSRPLLSRAVGETQRVLALTGRRPDQLAGLFLVGGSSRMPMVSKMLHEGLGIAPTVLEQPELPVSEGAALALAGPAPVTPPVAPPLTPPSPTATQFSSPPQQSGSLPPVTPASNETVMLRRKDDEPKQRRIPRKWIAIAAAVAVLAIVLPIGWWWITNPYKQKPFDEKLEPVGDTIAYTGEIDDGIFQVRSWGDRSAYFYTTASDDPTGQELHVRAVDNTTGESLWDEDAVFKGDGWEDETFYVSGDLIAFPQWIESSKQFQYRFLDWDSGQVLNTANSVGNQAGRAGDHLVIGALEGNSFDVYDAEGTPVSNWTVGSAENAVVAWDFVGTPDDIPTPTQTANSNGRVWVVTADNVTHVYEIESGELVAEKEVETVDDLYFGWNDLLYAVVDKETGYELNVYDIETGLSHLDSELIESDTPAPDKVRYCSETSICLREPVEGATDVYTWRVYDADEKEIVYAFDELEYRYMEPLGDRLLVEYYEGDEVHTQIYDKGFDPVGNSLGDSPFHAVDGGSAVAWPSPSGFSTSTGNVIGLGRDGTRTSLRIDLEVYSCDATETRLACLTPEGMQVFSFRDA